MNFVNRSETLTADPTVTRNSKGAARTSRSNTIALIDGRTLERECFVRTMEFASPRLVVVGYSSCSDWKSALDHAEPASVVLYNVGAREISSDAVATELRQLVEVASPTSVVVLGESEDIREMIAAVDCGACGYIPASVGVDAMVQAIRLTCAGGIFLPVNTLRSLRASIGPKRDEEPKGIRECFTSRQAAVAEALRRGKANKIIAYELNMCESTVKVHIRNIMKRLRATNRTEAAFKLNSMDLREVSSTLP